MATIEEEIKRIAKNILANQVEGDKEELLNLIDKIVEQKVKEHFAKLMVNLISSLL